MGKIEDLVQQQEEYVIGLRRYFHTYPEVSHKEFGTRKRIMEELDRLGIPYEPVEGTGLIARVVGKLPGKHRVIRSDIDALPVTEDAYNLRQKKVCISKNIGACHACGHDCHMAMLLTTLKILNEMKDELHGTIYGTFEEAEEMLGGWKQELAGLKKYPIDECFALHVYYHLDAGKVNIIPGPRMSGAAFIGVTFHGRSGHISRPDQALNPIIPLAHFITELNSVYNNRLAVDHPVTLGFGQIVAGTANNVIPDEASVYGSSRFFDVEEGKKASELIHRVAKNTADSFGCTVDFPLEQFLYPVVNDEKVALSVQEKFGELFDGNMLSECEPWYASESFANVMRTYPGALGFVGIRNEELGSGALHHNSHFDVDEKGLLVGVRTELAFALK